MKIYNLRVQNNCGNIRTYKERFKNLYAMTNWGSIQVSTGNLLIECLQIEPMLNIERANGKKYYL